MSEMEKTTSSSSKNPRNVYDYNGSSDESEVGAPRRPRSKRQNVISDSDDDEDIFYRQECYK